MIGFSLDREHGRFVTRLERAAELADDPAAFGATDPDVSAWSVGMHLEHLLRSNRGIVHWLIRVADGEDADRRRGRDRPTLLAWLVLLTGYIPRGRGKAPKVTAPEGLDREEVAEGSRAIAADARELTGDLPALGQAEPRMSHPVFGALSAPQWIRFGRIHHDHHGKIIRDIL